MFYCFKFDFTQATCPNICLQAINVLNNKDNIIDINNTKMQMSCSGPNGGIDLTSVDNPNPNNLVKNSSKLWLIILCIVIIIIICIICICKYFKFF